MEGVIALDEDSHLMSPSNFPDRVCFVLPVLLTELYRLPGGSRRFQPRIEELCCLVIQWTILLASVFLPTSEGFAEALSVMWLPEDQRDKVASNLIRFISRVTRRIQNMEVDAHKISDQEANLTYISMLDAGIIMVMLKASGLHAPPLSATERIYDALVEVMKKLDLWEQTRDMADDFRGMFKGLKNQETSEFSMCEYGLCFLKVEEKSGPAGLFTLSRSATLIYKVRSDEQEGRAHDASVQIWLKF
ncbi:hypothetical protein Moror_1804 [Moniliophthora roreri MCA 2997]|uniref:Uncharacterized protein n=1 Tax=Moniliophthora roreri (strain MCA 2997) TaxID=1381753 RepID=V2X2Q1_MONRO|nr:hypothetical protein Moror_1804 [Moniliophthora roreri MCA 2997]